MGKDPGLRGAGVQVPHHYMPSQIPNLTSWPIEFAVSDRTFSRLTALVGRHLYAAAGRPSTGSPATIQHRVSGERPRLRLGLRLRHGRQLDRAGR